MRRTYRHRIYPTRRQAVALDAGLVQACDLYNAALEHRRRMWRDHGRSVSFGDQSAELRELRSAGLLNVTANFWSQQDVLKRMRVGVSVRRNEFILARLTKLGLVDAVGRGVVLLYEEAAARGLPEPEITVEENWTTLTLRHLSS